MKIDAVSESLITLALFLDSKISGTVSEIWIDEEIISSIKETLPTEEDIPVLIDKTKKLIEEVFDKRRKKYIEEIVDSLIFQIENFDKKITFTDFSEKAYGFRIEQVNESEISKIESEISKIEKILGENRFEVLKKHVLAKNKYQSVFEADINEIRSRLPNFLKKFRDDGFTFELTSKKPWSAFNTHFAPYRSKLTLNTDMPFDEFYIYRLACHEAYGGHHSELSLKDQLLIDEGRGEHGLVITFSPQTFISEAIAEAMYVFLGILDENNSEMMLAWYYDRLVFALQNLASFLFFDQNLSRKEIEKKISKYKISKKTVEGILNFSTDPLFGKYAPVYYSAFNFIQNLYKKSENKQSFVKEVFTEPTTPRILKGLH